MSWKRLVPALAALALAGPACAQKPEDTEQAGPIPRIVTPAAQPGGPPSDAVVLFGGKDLSEWVSTKDKGAPGWTVEDGAMVVKLAAGNIETKRTFGSYQLHIEWKVPKGVTGSGQLRGNSGVFLASTGVGDGGYELQVLDSYENTTYVNGQAASIYKQSPPLVNAMRPAGEWQVYDVVWTAPAFAADGKVATPAKVTAFHNGVLVQNDFVLAGPTRYIGKPEYAPAHGRSPLKLQAHAGGGPVSFRNIWVRPLD